ncbi:MAG: T9SS type A sorting domain-containing protein [Candidatus Cloacimonetes bacterium]|nr:T9SS type A sorting domain-containing protein [Candidatus Cloacimonadota bacterium]
MQSLSGTPGSFADPIDVNYQYATESDYGVDELGAASAGVCVQSQDGIGRVTYWDGPDGSYRAMMSSVLFGSIIDGTGDNTKAALMSRYYSFMKIPPVSVDPPNQSDMILLRNHPNPFQTETSIAYSIPAANRSLTLEIFDIKGRLVRRFPLLDQSGTLIWDGTDQYGDEVSSGVYFYRFDGAENSVRKMMLMK